MQVVDLCRPAGEERWPDAPPAMPGRPPRLSELMPPGSRAPADKAAELARLVVAEAELAAYRVDLIASFAADRPAWTDPQPGDPGAAAPSWEGAGREQTVSEFFPDELALTLRCSRTAATVLIDVSLILKRHLHATWAALADGRIDWPRARGLAQVLAEAARTSPPQVIVAVEAAVLPTAMDAGVRALQDAARRELARLDAAGADRRREQATRTSQVRVTPAGDGMALLSADMAAPDAAACEATVDQLARRLKAEGDTRPIGLIRCEVLRDLILRPWDTSRPAVTAQLTVFASLATVQHAATHRTEAGPRPSVDADAGTDPLVWADPTRAVPAGEVDGQPITAAHLRALLEQLDALCPGGLQAPTGGSLLLGLTDPGTGRLRATLTRPQLERLARRGCPVHHPPTGGPAADDSGGGCSCPLVDVPAAVDRYAPTPAQRRYVTTRDRTCRHPGCRNRAGWADLDHVHPYGCGGATDCTNLCCACRRHHRLKTHSAGWRFVLDDDGTLHVTTPGGITRTSVPPGVLTRRDGAGRAPAGRAGAAGEHPRPDPPELSDPEPDDLPPF